MTLKMIYDNETDIPSGFEGEYAEREGKWELQVDGSYSNIDRDKLKQALEAERVITSQLKKENGSVTALQAELDNKNKIIAAIGDGGFDETKMNEMADQRAADRVKIATMERDHLQEKLDETNGNLSAMQTRVNSSQIATELRAAMKGKVKDTAQDIFLRLNSEKFEIVNGIVLTKDGVYAKPISVAEVVTTEVASDPDNFAPTSSGGGAEGGKKKGAPAGDNPFKTGNLSDALELSRLDPAKAKADAKAAGLNAFDPKFGPLIKSLG